LLFAGTTTFKILNQDLNSVISVVFPVQLQHENPPNQTAARIFIARI